MFKDKNKIKNLLQEQKTLLDNIPDGAMIYNFNVSNLNTYLDIKYTNSTLKHMIMKVISKQNEIDIFNDDDN